MDESEKRSRGVFARRQLLQQQPSTIPMATIQPSSPQRKSKRKMSDFMLGVAAALNARKNKNIAQAPASGGVIPRHIDFSYRDRTDVTAKRRFQVKVPFRLMAILGLVFLLIPGLVFLHKELHMHEDGIKNHYKAEHYVNVNTEEVWDNFKQATTDDAVQQEVKVNATVIKHQAEDHSGNHASNLQLLNHTGTKSVVHKNETKPFPTTSEEETNGDRIDHGNSASNEDPSPDVKSASSDQGKDKDLSSMQEAPVSPSDTNTLDEGNNNNKINDDNMNVVGTATNSTVSKNISER